MLNPWRYTINEVYLRTLSDAIYVGFEALLSGDNIPPVFFISFL